MLYSYMNVYINIFVNNDSSDIHYIFINYLFIISYNK